jgi:hypothetical protein
MSKRNAHAVAARQRKAGAHEDAAAITCDECGRDMGYRPPSHLCAPCTLGIKPDPREIFDVGERIEVVNEKGLYHGDQGRIVMRRNDFGDMSYGVVFDYDMSMCTVYFSGNQLKRVNT